MVSPTLESGHALGGRGMVGHDAPDAAAVATVVTPTDRVRWGPIIAGLFCALSALTLLGVLGLAVGFTAYDAEDRLRNFGIGAGIWAAASALIAFFVGGMISAKTAAVRGRGNALFQGSMVWVVAVPLVFYAMGSAVGSGARAVGAAANTAVQAGGAAANTNAGQQAQSQAQAQMPSADQVKAQAQQTVDQLRQNATPENAEQATKSAAKGAWGTLLSLVLGLAAAAVGGLVGARAIGTRNHPVAVPAT
jgi:hypothetical protein